MNAVKALFVAGIALLVANPAFAGRDEAQMMQQQRAIQHLRGGQGLAGPVGAPGRIGPGSERSAQARNLGHPTERIRP